MFPEMVDFYFIGSEEKLAIIFGMATHLIYCGFAICAHLLDQQEKQKIMCFKFDRKSLQFCNMDKIRYY